MRATIRALPFTSRNLVSHLSNSSERRTVNMICIVSVRIQFVKILKNTIARFYSQKATSRTTGQRFQNQALRLRPLPARFVYWGFYWVTSKILLMQRNCTAQLRTNPLVLTIRWSRKLLTPNHRIFLFRFSDVTSVGVNKGGCEPTNVYLLVYFVGKMIFY